MPEPPYYEIAELLREGEVVPFLGAGVNFGGRPPGASWDERNPSFLPSGAELSRFLAKRSNFPAREPRESDDLAKVASYFADTIAARGLRDRLRDVFNRSYAPCDIHTYLAGVRAPLLIVTTNYDDLTEQAFAQAGRPFDLVVHPTDARYAAAVLWRKHGATESEVVPPNQLRIDLSSTTVIYKMHGTVHRQQARWDSYVITEEDYVDFLTRMVNQAAVPAQFMQHFRQRHFLFLGYGLQDWNLRVVLKSLRSVLPRATTVPAADHGEADEDEELRSWAIQFRPSELETALWDSRNVKIYDVDINHFVARLREQEV